MNRPGITYRHPPHNGIDARTSRLRRRNRAAVLLRLMTGAVLFIVCVHRASAFQLVELHHADSLMGRVLPTGEDVRELSGRVHFSQGNVRVWCDRAIQYLSKNEFELIGSVKVIRDTVTLTSRYGRYFGTTKQAYCEQGVKLETKHVTLFADRGTYYTEERRAFFQDHVRIIDSTSTIDCDELTYYEVERKSIAHAHVTITNSENSIRMYGGHLDHYDQTHYSKLSIDPKMVQIDTSAEGKIDTLTVRSLVMESYSDSTRRLIATDSVTIVRSELSARGGLVRYDTRGEEIELHKKPIVWYEEHQVTGDTILIYLAHRRLDHAVVRGHAFALSLSDTAYPGRYNQLSGRLLTLTFREQKISQTVVERNAVSLYFLYDGRTPNGVNKTSGDYISMAFKSGKPDIIRVKKGIEGIYYPEPMVKRNTQAYNLDGFVLRTDRPSIQRQSL
ncbi:MAG TPA: OstA-like protein [Bacteroidota bacterium]|nr:OstA-like protein [Bacteroidota bacterium]